jgi:hypothetical protein
VWHNFGTTGGSPLPTVPPGLPIGQPGTPQVMFTKNVPGTPGFLPAVGIAPVHDVPSPLPNGKYRLESIPVLAVDTSSGPTKGHLYVTWADQQGDNTDVLLVSSSDGGMTWTAPVKVNQDKGKADQFMPWVTVDEQGGVLVSFYDRSYDAANTLLDMTLARSADGGKTWKQVRVTDQSWAVPDGCYHQTGPPFIGDYHAVVAAAGIAHPFFADGITGRCDVWTASVPYAAIMQGAGGNATGNGTSPAAWLAAR